MSATQMLSIPTAALLVTIWLVGCGRDDAAPQANPAAQPQPVKVVAVKVQSIARALEVTGEVVAATSVSIAATAEGPISFCPWREGDRIEKVGQKLIEIDRPSYREELTAAEAALGVAEAKLSDMEAGSRPEKIAQAEQAVRELEQGTQFAKTDLERITKLAESGSVPGETLDKARVNQAAAVAKLAAANEQLAMLKAGLTVTELAVQRATVKEIAARSELARARLAECVISAPFAGVVTKVNVRPGDLATAKAPLLELADLTSLLVRFAVAEADAPLLREGTKAAVTLDAYPGKTFDAEVVRAYPSLDRRMRTRTIEAKLAADGPELLPGMFARLRLRVGQVADAVVVPTGAIGTTPQGGRVAYVIADGMAIRRDVQVGIEEGEVVQILRGLNSGELVASGGVDRLTDNMPVKAQPAAAPATVTAAAPAASVRDGGGQ